MGGQGDFLVSAFHLATGEGRPEEPQAETKPRFHPALGFEAPK